MNITYCLSQSESVSSFLSHIYIYIYYCQISSILAISSTCACTVALNRRKDSKTNNVWTGGAGEFKFCPQIHLIKQVNDFLYQPNQISFRDAKLKIKVVLILKKGNKSGLGHQNLCIYGHWIEKNPMSIWLTVRDIWLQLIIRYEEGCEH